MARRQPADDPHGYILSLDWGDGLYWYATLAQAIENADSALAEGHEAAQVFHAQSEWLTEPDYDQEIEYTVHR